MTKILKRIREKLRKRMDWLYLRLLDCDGMCDHCDPVLKEICYRRKGRAMEDVQRLKAICAERFNHGDTENTEKSKLYVFTTESQRALRKNSMFLW